MPIYDYKCTNQTCNRVIEALVNSPEDVLSCPSCGALTRRLPPRVSIIIPSNMGRKLRTRVALDDELKKQGFNAPLFKGEEGKDKARWVLKKAGVK